MQWNLAQNLENHREYFSILTDKNFNPDYNCFAQYRCDYYFITNPVAQRQILKVYARVYALQVIVVAPKAAQPSGSGGMLLKENS